MDMPTPQTSSMWTAEVYVHLWTHTQMYESSFTFLDEFRNFFDLTCVLIMSSLCAIWTCRVALSYLKRNIVLLLRGYPDSPQNQGKLVDLQ